VCILVQAGNDDLKQFGRTFIFDAPAISRPQALTTRWGVRLEQLGYYAGGWVELRSYGPGRTPTLGSEPVTVAY